MTFRYPAGYKSSIPPTARERWLRTDAHGEREMECRVGRTVVGRRLYSLTGQLEMEIPLRRGKLDGVLFCWNTAGQPLSAIPYVDGLEHGTARQWGKSGRLIGIYRMRHGTGLDLWRVEREDGSVALAEARVARGGERHGFEWWVADDQRSVYAESHFHHGRPHGIERAWNASGGLRRGYPKYYVRGRRVTKRQYLRACRTDSTLPPFRPAENQPQRTFPAPVAKALGPPAKRRGAKAALPRAP